VANFLSLKSASLLQRLFAITLLIPGLAATAQTSRAISTSNVSSAFTNPEFTPRALSRLTKNASWHTDFTFDRSMLALAGKLEGMDAPTRQAIARLNSVTVHSYRYAKPDAYDQMALSSIGLEYTVWGWKHVVSKHGKPGTDQTSGVRSTDVWLHMDGMNVVGVAVLLAEPTNINLVSVSGDLSTVDLLHLRGHFGIPKFDSDDIGK
jgi:hypothetical protein